MLCRRLINGFESFCCTALTDAFLVALPGGGGLYYKTLSLIERRDDFTPSHFSTAGAIQPSPGQRPGSMAQKFIQP